jgi:hypothetical protein
MKRQVAILASLLLAGCATPKVAPVAPPPPPAPVVQPAPPRVSDLEFFSGLEAPQLRGLIGAPAFARKDGATEMWRYDIGSCHAFFFMTGTPAKVQHIETLPHGTNSDSDPLCLTALRATAKTS